MAKRFAVAAIEGYQKFIRCLLPCSCRFVPSCSEYSKQAIEKYGVCKGCVLAVKRLLRCHPFSGKSGFDPLL